MSAASSAHPHPRRHRAIPGRHRCRNPPSHPRTRGASPPTATCLLASTLATTTARPFAQDQARRWRWAPRLCRAGMWNLRLAIRHDAHHLRGLRSSSWTASARPDENFAATQHAAPGQVMVRIPAYISVARWLGGESTTVLPTIHARRDVTNNHLRWLRNATPSLKRAT